MLGSLDSEVIGLNIGALNITHASFFFFWGGGGCPYYNYRIMDLKSLFCLFRRLHWDFFCRA